MFKCSNFEEVKKEFDNNINSHSYMFYTNDFFSCREDIYLLLKNIFNVDNIDSIQSDLIIIKKSEKKSIVKEDMMDIKRLFQNTTYINKKRIYVIEEAHKLNSTTSNMILKFLEEPMEGVVALFITDNLDSVISTIKSRCQLVKAFYKEKKSIINDNDVNKLIDLLFYSNKNITLVTIKKEYEKYDRYELIDLFQKTLLYLYDNIEYDKLNKIKILNKAITMLSSNVNIDYVFDYILLKGSE